MLFLREKNRLKSMFYSNFIIHTLSGLEKSLCCTCAPISSSLSVIKGVRYFRAHESSFDIRVTTLNSDASGNINLEYKLKNKV